VLSCLHANFAVGTAAFCQPLLSDSDFCTVDNLASELAPCRCPLALCLI
jgi:hypothetical protein